MLLSLEKLRRLAIDVARSHGPSFKVLATLTGAGGSEYAEVLLTCSDEAGESLITIGVHRRASETTVRNLLAAKLRSIQSSSACPSN